MSNDAGMFVKRDPRPRLRPFVKSLWATAGPVQLGADGTCRERVLPTGDMHVVFRLSDRPLRLFDDEDDATGQTVGVALVGGARSACYVRDVSQPICSVGAQLHAGAARVLFGVPADELAERHVSLEALWGRDAELCREQLFDVGIPERQLDALESLLAARLPVVRSLHPAVAEALARFATLPDVGAAVKATGYSHRRFIALFVGEMGLTPKRFCRVLRFQRVLDRLAADPSVPWIDLALDSGYSDQSHFNRDFREFAGITPGEYRHVSPRLLHHVPVSASPRLRGSISSKTA